MTQRLFNLKTKKTISDDGKNVRSYIFDIEESMSDTPSVDCILHIKNGKIDNVRVLIHNDDKFRFRKINCVNGINP